MITLRRAQIQALGQIKLRHFEQRAAAHLEKYFPAQCEVLGAVKVLDAVRYGIERASGYHLESERDLLRYLTLMFTFGRDFDTDPDFPWAGEILRDTRTTISRTDRLQVMAINERARGRGYVAHPEGSENREGF